MSTPHPLLVPLLIGAQAVISAASLVVEIVAGRMIAPYVGMSLYSWTAIIAVVLAGFSAGHWWGGRIAARPTGAALRITGWSMLGAAATTAAAALLLRWVAGPVLLALPDPLSAITVLTLICFFLPSLFAGVPAPVLAVVAMRGNPKSEQALGAMFAAGAIGAIVGTLLAGFLFISWLGSALTLAAVTGVYLAAAALFLTLGRRGRPWPEAIVAFAALGGAVWALSLPPVCDRESRHYCIRTVTLSSDPGDPVRLMAIDHLAHGIGARNTPRLMFTEHAAMLDALPRMRFPAGDFTSFQIGGGSYSVPRAWKDRGIGGITVAEIDPEVTARAAADFWFDPDGIEIIHDDARRVLADRPARYDAILGDAFTDIAVPAHLVTREFFELVQSRLTDRGIYVMNVIDRTDRLDALAALIATLEAVFPVVEVWTEARTPQAAERRVFVLLAAGTESPVSALDLRAPDPMTFAPLDPGFVAEIVETRAPPILTDDYAPIDRLVGLAPLID